MNARVYVTGMVQGVGFRYFVKSRARRLGLTGWVTNTKDGGVEALFTGPKDKIEKIIEECRKGPFIAQVSKVDVKWEDPKEEYSSFEIAK